MAIEHNIEAGLREAICSLQHSPMQQQQFVVDKGYNIIFIHDKGL